MNSPDEANPVGIPNPGTSIHPTIGAGATGPAVEELQQKLNGAGAAPPVPVDGQFGPATVTAVNNFQTAQGLLPATGQADNATWARLDALAPGATVGRVERRWGEEVGGQRFGMTSRYTWRINPGEIRVTVRINFTGLAPKPTWFGFIRTTWNLFKAVETTTNEEMNIEFDPQQVTSGADNTVNVAVGPGRANAAQWFLTDPDEANTIPHEFGHMVGLQDEYQLTAADYERTTGHIAPVGELTGTTGASATSLARQLNTAVTGPDPTQYGADAHRVVRDNGIRQGAFAQQIATSYQRQFGQDIVTHMAAQIPDATPGTPGFDEFEAIDPFRYSSGSTMGDPSRHPDAHDHGVQPRHVREFVDAIRANKGGTWEVRPR
ncbi:MAG: peptidoglycan-binding protein [Anaerolineales bacterium]|nr:peptidoglycan-binding protein [Anaerolineales bacterium]